jgi:hypothetical protein
MKNGLLLAELAREVRQSTLDILSAARPDWLTWAPPGTTNHILWHAGHALWLSDLMCVEPLSGRSELPPGWAQAFGMDSQPASTTHWPTRDEVKALLTRQLARMIELLAAATDDQLSSPVPSLKSRSTLAGWIIHGLHDEAKHSGEMYLLWKLCHTRKRP